MCTITLSFQTEHKYSSMIVGVNPNAISNALAQAFQGAGIPFPAIDIDLPTLRVSTDGSVLNVTYERRNWYSIAYDNASELSKALEKILFQSSLVSGIAGVIPETIRFEIEG